MVEEGKQTADLYDAAVSDLKSNTEPGGLETEQPTAPDAAQSNQEAAEPQEPVYDINGEKVPLSTIMRWKGDGMMQSDYTRKTQELAREREQLNLLRQTLEESLYGDMAEPAKGQAVQAQGKYRDVPVDENIEFATPTEERLYRELQEVKSAVGSIFQRQRMENVRAVNAKIDNSIDSFMKAHPEVDSSKMNEVLSHANKIGIREVSPEAFEYVYRSLQDPKEIERRAIERYVEEQKKKAPAALESPAGVSSSVPQEDYSKLDDEEIYARMLRDLQLGQT